MLVYSDFDIDNFEAWSGGEATQNKIVQEDKAKDFNMMVEELFPDGCTDTEMNDFLWFDRDFIYSSLGIRDEDDE